MRQHSERGDEAEAEEAVLAEQGRDFRVTDGEVRGDDAGEDERPDDAPGQRRFTALLAGCCSLPGECFCA